MCYRCTFIVLNLSITACKSCTLLKYAHDALVIG